MNILDDLKYRGLVKDVSNEESLRKLLDTPQTIYVGFDPSASSLHLGNFLMISLLMRFQRAGHRIIAVIGGATGMIGDPSGKSSERNLLSKEDLDKNVANIKKQLEKFIDLSDPKKGILLNNYDWLSKISTLDLLRDYGKHFSINYLLSKDIIASRLESGISFTEFSYNILQAIDFLYLFDNYDCHIQCGGSDQWGNLTSGLELIRKTRGADASAEVLTTPLITRSDGTKFGKSEKGALFLDPSLTSPYKLYQFLINCADDEVINYLKVFTFLSREEIEAIEKEHNAHPGARIGQKKLAFELTSIIHGVDKAEEAMKMSEVLFSGDIKTLSEDQLTDVFSDFLIDICEPKRLEDLLVAIGAASSKREAREFLGSGSILVNGEKTSQSDLVIDKSYALHSKFTLVRRGKKNYYLVRHSY
ncbi:MAG: tyrosine--tRNA ligase [Coprobacillus sp.]|nr:tyrosine--tRNA ligase [Coprobacillus sp.]